MSKQGQSEVMKSRPGEANMRVPGAIDQKTSEVQPSEISESERAHALNPGRFVESFRHSSRTTTWTISANSPVWRQPCGGQRTVGIGLAVGEQLLDVTEQTPSIAEKSSPRGCLAATSLLRRSSFARVRNSVLASGEL